MAQGSSASDLSRPATGLIRGRRLRLAPFVSLLVYALFAGGLVLASANAIEPQTCQPSETTHPFSDVAEDSFAYDAVACIYLLGVTTGTTPTTFSPDEYVTREQMASFMARLYEAVTGTAAPIVPTPFTDMPTDSFAYDDIARIYGLNITTGTTPTTYSPYFYVTREEMASFLARLYRAVYGQDAPVVLMPFFDVPFDSFAYDDIGQIYGLGLTTGTTTTTYSPHLNVTREEMAAFLARFRQLPSPPDTTTTTTTITITNRITINNDPDNPPSPPQDEAPVITAGARSVDFPEDRTDKIVGSYTTSDPEGAAITWSLSGVDSGQFALSRSGVLTFNQQPDYEQPIDSDNNNEYEVTVQATDQTQNTGQLEVTVTVSDIEETPPEPDDNPDETSTETDP